MWYVMRTHVYLCEITCSRAYIHSAMYTSLPGILYRLQDHYGLPNYNLILYTFRTCSPEDVREMSPDYRIYIYAMYFIYSAILTRRSRFSRSPMSLI